MGGTVKHCHYNKQVCHVKQVEHSAMRWSQRCREVRNSLIWILSTVNCGCGNVLAHTAIEGYVWVYWPTTTEVCVYISGPCCYQRSGLAATWGHVNVGGWGGGGRTEMAPSLTGWADTTYHWGSAREQTLMIWVKEISMTQGNRMSQKNLSEDTVLSVYQKPKAS